MGFFRGRKYWAKEKAGGLSLNLLRGRYVLEILGRGTPGWRMGMIQGDGRDPGGTETITGFGLEQRPKNNPHWFQGIQTRFRVDVPALSRDK